MIVSGIKGKKHFQLQFLEYSRLLILNQNVLSVIDVQLGRILSLKLNLILFLLIESLERRMELIWLGNLKRREIYSF